MFEKYFGRYKQGLELLRNEEYENAYEAFSNLINKNPKDYKARAYRGIISAIFLNKSDEEIYQDLKLGIKAPYNLSSRIYSLYSDVCFNVKKYDEAVEYAQKAINAGIPSDTNYLLLARYYIYEKNDKKLINTALEYINYLMNKMQNDELIILKAHAYIKLDKYEEVQPLVDKLFFSSSNVDNAYLIQADAIFYNPNSSDEDLKKAINSYQEAINLIKDNEIKIDILLKISEIHKHIESFEDLIKTSELIFTYQDNHPVAIFNKAIGLAALDHIDDAINLLEANLDTTPPHLELYSNRFLALWYYQKVNSENDLKMAVKYAVKAANLELNHLNYALIIDLYEALYDFENVEKYADMYMKLFFKYPYGYYMKGYSLFLKRYPFKKYIRYYKMAAQFDNTYQKDYLLLNYERTNRTKKAFNKIKSDFHNLIMQGLKANKYWAYRYAALGYFYGEYGFDVNIDEAYVLVNQCLELNDNSCDFTLKGAILLKQNQHFDEAGRLFEHSHNEFISYKTPCSCGSAFLARMYLEGIHFDKDEPKAMKITLDSYNKAKKYMHSNSAILYAYFALLNKENFDLNLALENLKNVENELYYNSPVFYMLKEIYLKLNNHEKANYYYKRMEESLLYEGKTIKEEMLEKLKSNHLFLPPFNNF